MIEPYQLRAIARISLAIKRLRRCVDALHQYEQEFGPELAPSESISLDRLAVMIVDQVEQLLVTYASAPVGGHRRDNVSITDTGAGSDVMGLKAMTEGEREFLTVFVADLDYHHGLSWAESVKVSGETVSVKANGGGETKTLTFIDLQQGLFRLAGAQAENEWRHRCSGVHTHDDVVKLTVALANNRSDLIEYDDCVIDGIVQVATFGKIVYGNERNV